MQLPLSREHSGISPSNFIKISPVLCWKFSGFVFLCGHSVVQINKKSNFYSISNNKSSRSEPLPVGSEWFMTSALPFSGTVKWVQSTNIITKLQTRLIKNNTSLGEITMIMMMMSIILQQGQLSQRYRAMLCVIEYFAKSFKVTQDHSKRYHSKARVQFPIRLSYNYGSILYYLRDKARSWPKVAIFSYSYIRRPR